MKISHTKISVDEIKLDGDRNLIRVANPIDSNLKQIVFELSTTDCATAWERNAYFHCHYLQIFKGIVA